MSSGEKTLYPMLGVGAFFVMFWIGFVVGYDLGLSCWLFVLNAFLFACSGAWFVARLESASACPQPQGPVDTGNAGEPRRHSPPAYPHAFTPGTR